MAWKYDMNGRRVWVDDGVITSQEQYDTIVAERKRREALPFNPRGVAMEAQQRAFKTLVKPIVDFADYKTPGFNDDVVRGAPFKPTPAPTVSGAAGEPFIPTAAPARLPPETVEATRLPPERPIVEATVMRRGWPGSGEFGERSDLTPVSVRDFTPMSRAEAERRGLMADAGPGFDAVRRAAEAPQIAADRETEFSRVIYDRRGILQRDADASMEMTSPAAQRMRAQFDDESAGRAAARAARATGRVGAGRDIVADIMGERRADAESGRRMREARVTPVATGDTVYDPLTGRAHTAPAKGPVKPQAWDEYAPEDLEGMINRTVKSILPADQEKAMWAELGTATTDEAKAAVIGKYTRQATPEQRLILDNAYEALRRKSIAGQEGGRGAGGAGVYKPGMFGKK